MSDRRATDLKWENGKHSSECKKRDRRERKIAADRGQREEYSGDGDDDADASQSEGNEEKREEYNGEKGNEERSLENDTTG